MASLGLPRHRKICNKLYSFVLVIKLSYGKQLKKKCWCSPVIDTLSVLAFVSVVLLSAVHLLIHYYLPFCKVPSRTNPNSPSPSILPVNSNPRGISHSSGCSVGVIKLQYKKIIRKKTTSTIVILQVQTKHCN